MVKAAKAVHAPIKSKLRGRIADLLRRLDDCWSLHGTSVNVEGLQRNQSELRELRKLTAGWQQGRVRR